MASTTDQLLVCDLTQSYSPRGGGGVSTYLKEKRRYVKESTDHRLLQIYAIGKGLHLLLC